MSETETIPEDIMEAARAAYDELPLLQDGQDDDACVTIIARAIMAERERWQDDPVLHRLPTLEDQRRVNRSFSQMLDRLAAQSKEPVE